MKDRTKDFILGIFVFIICVLAFSFVIDTLMIDGLSIDVSFLGSVVGSILGAIVLGATTFYIIDAQKKVNLEQIEAQRHITLKQVSNADFNSRLLLLTQIKLNNYERTLKTLIDLEYQIKIFEKNAINFVALKIFASSGITDEKQNKIIKDAENLKDDTYYSLNNSILSLITYLRIDKEESALLTIAKIQPVILKVADEAEILKIITVKKETTIEEVESKVAELHSIFIAMSNDLRSYIFERIEKVEMELIGSSNT